MRLNAARAKLRARKIQCMGLWLTGLLLPMTALANDNPCEAASKQAAARCSADTASRAETALAQAYQDALAATGGQVALKRQLTVSQKQWQGHRGHSCQLETALVGNTDIYWEIAVKEQCNARMARERILMLQYYGCLLTEDPGHCSPP